MVEVYSIVHMGDSLVSPVVGGILWAAAAGVAAYSIKKIKLEQDEKKIPLMGVMGAFVFAAQMINFSIPAVGSSGHIGGGILLATLLGPYAGFLTMMSILLIQALVFGDGGLLAYGCNAINMGFFTCFVAYPLIYRLILKKGYTKKRIFVGALSSAVAGLQLGAFAVVLETSFSGIAQLPFVQFILPMQFIHLAIGVVEGLITAAILTFIYNTRPELIEKTTFAKKTNQLPLKNVLIIFLVAAVLMGGVLSYFASAKPDGLEWSIFKTAGQQMETTRNAFLNVGTGIAGIAGGALTLALVIMTGVIIHIFKRKNRRRGS